MSRKTWTKAECRKYGRLGGLKRAGKKLKTPDWRQGYQSGWAACEKFWRTTHSKPSD